MTSDDELSIDLKMGRRGTLPSTVMLSVECKDCNATVHTVLVGFLSPIDPPRTRFGTVAPPPV